MSLVTIFTYYVYVKLCKTRFQILYTYISGAACGVALAPGRTYVLPVKRSGAITRVTYRNYVVNVKKLTKAQLALVSKCKSKKDFVFRKAVRLELQS